jgi:hypothetical protein
LMGVFDAAVFGFGLFAATRSEGCKAQHKRRHCCQFPFRFHVSSWLWFVLVQ